MKNTMRKSIVTVLLISLLVSLCACGGSKKLSDTIVGNWKGDVNVGDELKEAFGELEGFDTSALDDITMTFLCEFKADKSMHLKIDATEMIDQLAKVLEPYAGLLGMDASDLASALAEQFDTSALETDGSYEVDDEAGTGSCEFDAGGSQDFTYEEGKITMDLTDSMGMIVELQKQ